MLKRFTLIFSLFLIFTETTARAIYIDTGLSTGSVSNAQKYFGLSSAPYTSLPFIGSLGIYFHLIELGKLMNLQLGIQNRMTLASGTPQNLTMVTNNVATRFEISRFMVGFGYAPITWDSITSATALKINTGKRTAFFEVGAIWYVVPELQIVPTVGYEFGYPGFSPTVLEYGLHFRFWLNPSESASSGAKGWDGFRYPFGLMRD